MLGIQDDLAAINFDFAVMQVGRRAEAKAWEEAKANSPSFGKGGIKADGNKPKQMGNWNEILKNSR